jgi:hypothetical protein
MAAFDSLDQVADNIDELLARSVLSSWAYELAVYWWTKVCNGPCC